MQIRISHSVGARIASNAVSNNLSAGKAHGKVSGLDAGPQCKVTISREGRRLSGQAQARSVQAGQMERVLLRQQDQKEKYKEEHSRLVDEIASLRNTLNNTGAVADKETIEKKQMALDEMESLKKLQEEENKQRLKAAAGGIAGISEEQGEVDKENADLYVMLKSFEEEEEDGEGQEVSGETEDGEAAAENADSMSDKIRQSAGMLGVSAARREMASKDVVEELRQDGMDKLAQVKSIMNEITGGLKEAEEIMRDDSYGDAERYQLATEALGRSRDILMSSMGDLIEMRGKALQELQDARELKLKRLEMDPLENVGGARERLMTLASEAAFSEASEKVLSEASQELADRVQEEIDKRNDAAPDTKDEVQEEEKTAEEIREEQQEQEAVDNKTTPEGPEETLSQIV